MSALSRREVLARGAVLGGAAVGANALAACSSDDKSGTGDTTGEVLTAPADQKRGGRLRVGMAGAGARDTVNPLAVPTGQAWSARTQALFGYIIQYDTKYEIQPRLAESVEPDGTGKAWTIRLKDGLEWHNGKTIGADDVIFTFETILDPKTAAPSAAQFSALGIERMRKLDARTVRLELAAPNALVRDTLTDHLVPVGFDPAKPVGSGPFKLKSFTPGQDSTFVRFENYYDEPAFVDELEVVNFDDDSARVNALLSNQVDAIAGVPYSQVQLIERSANHRPLIAKGGAWRPFVMRVDVKPFSDHRVREAIRLLADREQMVKQALNGYGQVGNDVPCIQDPNYDKDIPQREHDPERARALLKQAGLENGEVTLITSPIQAGVLEASQILAENAKAAGLTIKLNRIDQGVLYGERYKKWPFVVDYFPTRPWEGLVGIIELPGSPFNATHFEDPEFTELYGRASVELDDAKRRDLIHQMQAIQHERGGYLIWGFADTVSAYSSKVTGFVSPDKRGEDLTNFEFERVSFV